MGHPPGCNASLRRAAVSANINHQHISPREIVEVPLLEPYFIQPGYIARIREKLPPVQLAWTGAFTIIGDICSELSCSPTAVIVYV